MHPRNVACPTCGTPVGMPCTNPWGYFVVDHHQARIDLATTR